MALDEYHISLSCLRRIPIFEGLTDQEVDKLYTMIHWRTYEKGENVFREGEHSESLYVLNQGVVKLSKVSESGKEQIFRFLFPGDFFGQFAMLQDKQHYANAEVMEHSVVYHINKRHMTDLMKRNSDMTFRILVAVSERLHQADEWMGAMNLLEIEQRLAKILTYFHQKQSSSSDILTLPVAKKELAAMIGVTTGTLSGKLVCLEKQNIIALGNHKIRILDPVRLREFAGESIPKHWNGSWK